MIELEGLPGALGTTRAMAISTDGDRLACVTDAHELVMWNLVDLSLIFRKTVEQLPEALVFDAGLLVFPRWDGIDWLDTESGEVVRTERFEGFDYTRAISVCGDMVAFGGNQVLLVKDGTEVASFGPWKSEDDWDVTVRGIAWHPDQSVIAVSFDQFTLVLDRDGAELKRFDDTRAAVFSPDGNAIATSGYQGAFIRDWPSGEPRTPLEYEFDAAVWTSSGILNWDSESAVCFDDAGQTVWASRFYDDVRCAVARDDVFYTASRFQWIARRSAENGSYDVVLPAGGGGEISSMQFVDDDTLVVSDETGRVTVWDIPASVPRSVIDSSSMQQEHEALEIGDLKHVEHLWIDGKVLNVVASRHFAWADLFADDLAHVEPTQNERTYLTISPSGLYAVARDWENDRIDLVRTSDYSVVSTLPNFEPYSCDVVVADDGMRVLFIEEGTGTSVRIWGVPENRYVRELEIDHPTRTIHIRPDGCVVGWVDTYDWRDEDTEDSTGVFFAWNPETDEVTRWLTPVPELVHCNDVIFRQGSALFFGDNAFVYNGEIQTVGTIEQVRKAAYSPSGKRIALAGRHGVIEVIDLEDGDARFICMTSDGSFWTRVAATEKQ